MMDTVKPGDTLLLKDGNRCKVYRIEENSPAVFPYAVYDSDVQIPVDCYTKGGLSQSGHKYSVIGVVRKAVADWEDTWRRDLGADPQYCRVVDDRPASGIKHDSGKPDMSLLPADVLWEVAEVLTHGAKVYGKYNWTKGFDYTRLQAAVLRHINQWSRGIEKDADSGKSHLTHALCGLMMLRAMELRGLGTDDRDTTGYEKK